jgi:hypothetical protein
LGSHQYRGIGKEIQELERLRLAVVKQHFGSRVEKTVRNLRQDQMMKARAAVDSGELV